MAFRYLGIMHPHPVFILVADVLPVLEISRLHAAGAKTTVIRFGLFFPPNDNFFS